MKRLLSTIAILGLVVLRSFGQFTNFPLLEYNNIVFNYDINYQKVILKNKVKRSTSSYPMYGKVVQSGICEYDRNGKIIKTENFQYYKLNGYRKYDASGRLIEKGEVIYMNQAKSDTNQIIKFWYDEKNKINKKTIWYKKKTEYGADIMQQKRFTNKLEVFIYKNYYNEKNQLIKQQEFSADSLFQSYFYKYDDNGNLYDFQIWWKEIGVTTHFVFTYDSANRVINTKYDTVEHPTVYNNSEQVLHQFNTIKYYKNGLIQTISKPSENEGTTFVETFKYEYYK